MITSKECTNCHKTKTVGSYYIHRDNKTGYGLDNTCKECTRKLARDIDGLKKYCDMNCRKFSQELFDIAEKTVKEKYKDDIEFNSLSEEKRESFLFKKIVNIYFSRMGGNQYYQYQNTEENSIVSMFDIEEIKKEQNRSNSDNKPWSSKWRGHFTKDEIDYLESYCADNEKDFTISTRNYKDYSQKIAKASLAMDEAYDDMMNGVAGADKKYKDAKMAFDSLSQSAKFSEKTRSANDVAGLGSLSEIVARLEQTGFLQKKIEFEDDDIDKINKDLRHVLSSMD